ncbi:phosphatase PAP2 family protein [Limnochorda pilosa]|uniref:Phosphoesterase n=1 Tax=Limnochorda pilosa TaxID=1555112 RepID=A0A0K2SHR5_LIMPI|nr:phosphatase PAP2 family protein [Limnochorda pilosa]BAS26635.1 phosphoesterase [Limnochorda pilosa]
MRTRVVAFVLLMLVAGGPGASAASPDEAVAGWVRSWDAPWLGEVARLGEAPVHLGAVLVLLAAGDGGSAGRVVEAEVGAAVATWAGKVALGRARPWTGEGAARFAGPSLAEAHHSFPSGHTSSAFALATVLAGRYPDGAVVWYALAAGVGLSRIYTGDHWPSDVLAGAAVGHLAGRAALEGRPWFGFRWNF